ncbi:MAG: ABC transporter permease [Planifilum fimeticola]
MAPSRWFFNRWRADLRFQCRVFSTVVDWTVALYLVIPGLILLVERYIAWWKGGAAWVAEVPSLLLWTASFLFSWSGPFRLYLEPADQLFLLQRSDWMRTYTITGLWFGWGKRALESGLFLGLLAPFLRHEIEVSSVSFVRMGLFLWQAKACLALVRRFLAGMDRMLLKGLLTGFTLVLGWAAFVWIGRDAHPFGFYAGAAVCAGCTGLLAWLRSRQKGALFTEIDYDQAQRMRWTALLLQTSGVVHRRYWDKKRPLLFPRSNPLFRRRTVSHIVAEAVIKSFLRSGRQLIPYFQLVAVCAVALLVTPTALRWGCWILFSFLFSLWGRSVWREWRSSNGMFDVWAQSGFKVRGAFQKAVFVLQQIGFLPLSAVMGAVTFGPWGMVWMIGAGWAFSRYTVSLFARREGQAPSKQPLEYPSEVKEGR